MIYLYDKKNLVFTNVTKKTLVLVFALSILLSSMMILLIIFRVNQVRYISEETKAIIINESNKENQFSPKKLKAYILELNIKFPHIVYAQAKLESGNFNSEIFKTNHNLFGMKVATKRPTTNKGEENGHAYFDNWKESVVDYAFYQSSYLSDIKTESNYFEYLKQSYAEDPLYVEKLKKIISENQ